MTAEWWRGSVLYQIYPRSFYDSNGDGVGDLAGITQRLDYVAALGVAGVWISPFFKSPMADFGYDVSDYRDIDPLFGTLPDFDQMLSEMHARGLKLIIDLVMNHTSNKHAWFRESRTSRDNEKSDWYVWADPKPDGTAPNNWLSVFGGPAWTYDTKRGQYYLHQFLKEQPDLNVRNPVVQDMLLDTAKWWLDKGVDGLRLDVLNHCIQDAQLRDNPPRTDFDRGTGSDRFTHPYFWQRHLYDRSQPECLDFARRLRTLTDTYDARMMVGEIFDDYPVQASVAYTEGTDKLHTAYSFSLLQPLYTYTPDILRGYVQSQLDHPDSWPTWAFSNHDNERAASRWNKHGAPDTRQVKMLNALLMTLRGTAFLYQGEELGLGEADVPFDRLQDPYGIFLYPEDKGRDGCRTPMPWDGSLHQAGFTAASEAWLPIPAQHMARAVTQQEADPQSPLHFTRGFIAWRKAHDVFRMGLHEFIDMPAPILAYRRYDEKSNIFCAFNLGDTDVTAELPFACSPLDGHGLPATLDGKTLQLPPYGAFFGVIKK